MLQTRKCLDELNELFQTRPDVIGPDLLDRIVDLYFMTVDQHSANDTDAFGDVMTRIAYAGDAMARAKLAERMCWEDLAPLELLRQLACDDIVIARPVLQFSSCLREGDLISIIEQVDQKHMFATAQRRMLSIPVTDLLMQRGEEMVHVAMARNIGAQFSPAGQKHFREVALSCSELHDALQLRRDMNPGSLIRLKRLADARFWQQIAEARFWRRIAESLLMTEVQYAAAATDEIVAQDDEEPQLDAEVSEQPSEQVDNTDSDEMPSGIISEFELVNAAEAGDIENTLEYFSTIVQLNQDMARHCMFEAHITALMVLCRANKLEQATFKVLLSLRENHTGEPTDDTVGLMRRYDEMTPETAQRIIRFSNKLQKIDNEGKEKGSEPDSRALAS